jgi:hypothetical protein
MLSEERRREILASVGAWPKPPKAKPKPAIVAAVSDQLAAAARANPESVRVSARASDDTIVVDRPRRTEVLEVLEVDAAGRPAIARRYDALTGERSIVEFDQGYRRHGGAESEYSPLSRLRGDVDG